MTKDLYSKLDQYKIQLLFISHVDLNNVNIGVNKKNKVSSSIY